MKWWPMRKNHAMPDTDRKAQPSPELKRVQALVREAAILGPQVEQELAKRMRRQ